MTTQRSKSYSEAERISSNILGDITNSEGHIRLSCVRNEFKFSELRNEEGREIIKRCFKAWVSCDEYLLFAVIDKNTSLVDKWVAVKCAKRGNDVYRWRMKKRLSWIDNLEDKEFFNPKDRNVRGKTTRMLFVSLSYDTKRCSRKEAWEYIGKEWNRWITAVRKKYGRVKVYRCFEAHGNGYPHVHAVLVFQDAKFEVSYRLKDKFRILRTKKNWFADKWHSFVDVQACYSTGAFGYVKKYMLKFVGDRSKATKDVKGIKPDEAIKTLSLLWLFRKQSFSVSGGMQELIHDLIEVKHNSNLIVGQITLEGEELYIWELDGIYTLEEIAYAWKPPPNASEKWSFEC